MLIHMLNQIQIDTITSYFDVINNKFLLILYMIIISQKVIFIVTLAEQLLHYIEYNL